MNPIRLDTPRRLYQYDHKIALHCEPCNRWRELTLEEIEEAGVADSDLLALRFRCRDCGSEGATQIRPPVPVKGRAHQGNV